MLNLDKLFDPSSIAIIGATPEKNKVGYSLLYNLLQGKKRNLYPVTLSRRDVLGLPAYPSVLKIPAPIDLALIAVRADIVPGVLAECGKKRVPYVAIISAGFKEAGAEGKILEKKIIEIAKKYSITLLGPNCLGVINTESGLNATFANGAPAGGKIAFVSQSGALGVAALDWANSEGIGFSKFVSLGNEAGLTELEFLEYFAGDKSTDAVLLYLEKITDGEKFMRLAKALAKKKPVVILRAGRSAGGQRAAMSHTGSLAPADAVFASACEEAGVIAVESIRELFGLAKLFQIKILSPLKNLIVLTNAGGPSIVTADAIDLSRSLQLAKLSTASERTLKKVLPPMASFGNPVDILGDALATRYQGALEALSKEKGADAILLMLTPQMMTETEATAELLGAYAKIKPIIPVFLGGTSIEGGVNILKKNGLVNFEFPEDAVDALDAMASLETRKHAPAPKPSAETQAGLMDLPSAKKLLAGYGIKTEGVFVRAKKDLEKSLKAIRGYPVAMKVVSKEVIHKTEAGGVLLNLKTAKEASEAWDKIVKNVKRKIPKAKIGGMLIQPMLAGKEIIIGMKRDPVFGPVIVFGMGGIFAEALKDVSMAVAPVNDEKAREMIESIKGFSILKGMRGEKSVNMKKLQKLIVSVSRLALAHPEISELDLNPVLATAQ
ncbi:MAG: acetate--CoA ligase family protein, partial [Candidatus Liptonbacteria bacterium]|nr:acetate--CoA ligase family protein [Candidatus Liptonbacteria bacterium]